MISHHHHCSMSIVHPTLYEPTTPDIVFDLSADNDNKDNSEQEDCDNEFQTDVGLSGFPGQQGLSFFGFFPIKW